MVYWHADICRQAATVVESWHTPPLPLPTPIQPPPLSPLYHQHHLPLTPPTISLTTTTTNTITTQHRRSKRPRNSFLGRSSGFPLFEEGRGSEIEAQPPRAWRSLRKASPKELAPNREARLGVNSFRFAPHSDRKAQGVEL